MTRRIASKVLQQTSRLLEARLIQKPPAWYQAVIDHPPLPLPPRAPPQRSSDDLPVSERSARLTPRKYSRTPKPHPLPVRYIEDDVRRQFFKDHPFEAFRPIPLTEQGKVEEQNPPPGYEWTRLRQRGRNPTPEDAVRFTVHLHTAYKMSLSGAYESAVHQFRALRSEQYIMTCFAALEAEAHGAVFLPGEIERGMHMEAEALESWEQGSVLDAQALAARKRWRAVVERRDPGQWTRGQGYVRLWKEGVRPDYSPVTKAPESTPEPDNLAKQPRPGWQSTRW